MKIALPRPDKRFFGRNGKRKTIARYIDEDCFTGRYLLHFSYMCYWERPDKTIYIKFTSFKPYDYLNGGYMPINGSNQYNHRLIKIEKCYVVG